MENLKIRRANLADLTDILKIYDRARRFMAETGNPTQWGNGYPQRELLEEDIANEKLFVVTAGEIIRGVFLFVIGPDPTYSRIENGGWHADRLYGTIHRIASDGTGGVFAIALEFCRQQIDYLRIDTHENNRVMQHVVTKWGFRRCGIIFTDDGTPRIAYDRMEDCHGKNQ